MEAVVSEMKRQLEDGDLELEQKVSLLNGGIHGETGPAQNLSFLWTKSLEFCFCVGSHCSTVNRSVDI